MLKAKVPENIADADPFRWNWFYEQAPPFIKWNGKIGDTIIFRRMSVSRQMNVRISAKYLFEVQAD
ncbi:MAG: hypothetical protein ABSC61_07570 [Anaerolineales bacterium]